MTEVLQLSLQIALGILFPALVIRKDLARLSPLLLARAWNDASLWSAIVAFGPISLIVHFAKTRRSVWGCVLGALWAAANLLVSAAGASLLEHLF